MIILLISIGTVFGQGTKTEKKSEQEIAVKPPTQKEIQKEIELRGCGTTEVNYRADTDTRTHPTPDAPADKAMIYVLRPANIGSMLQSKLAVDGDWKGVNRGRNYFYFTLDPGDHYFCSRAENKDAFKLFVQAGKTYYLQQKVQMGFMKARTNLVSLDDAEGKKKLKDVRLSVFVVKPN